MTDLDLLTEHADTTRPFDRWPGDDFAGHRAAEGVELHAHRRLGGPPIFYLALVGAAGNAVLELLDEQEVDGE